MANLHPPASPEALYQAAQQEVAGIVAAVSSGKPCELSALQRMVAGTIASLASEDGLLVLALKEGETHLDLPRHLVNVAILAIKIGQGIGYAEDDLQRLALAACLHDVGMTSVPRRILEKPGVLAPEELALIRQHPEQGFRMLQALGPEFEWVATVALHEQERQDGSGYPQGLKGDQIHEYAKIVGLADLYESLTHARPYQSMRAAYDAPEIARQHSRDFPDRLLQAMVRALSTSPATSPSRQAAGAEPTQ
ncbi:MAG: HD-GYP domain-containing protein, partial [Candidatus Methylomirabilales bacterium]